MDIFYNRPLNPFIWRETFFVTAIVVIKSRLILHRVKSGQTFALSHTRIIKATFRYREYKCDHLFMTLVTFLKHLKKRIVITFKLWFSRKYILYFFPRTYSQAGEDIILSYLFNELQIANPTYLDIGANYPIAFNNTYFLYQKGCRGVCVEADPTLIPELKKYRKKDRILNVGVGVTNEKELDFYIYDAKGLNTFSKEEVEQRSKFGTYQVQKVIKIPSVTINDIISQNFSVPPNFLSIDVEGLDLDILKSMDFNKYRPDVICVETITYDEGRGAKKIKNIVDFVCSQGYIVYADTHINTIFAAEKYYPQLKNL